MVVKTQNAAATRAPTTSTKTGGALLTRIQDANKRAKLGSLSVRFAQGSKELKAPAAFKALAAGEPVQATLVTWKTYKGGGKLTPTSRKVRVKVRGIDAQPVSSAGALAKWFTAAEKAAAAPKKTAASSGA
jgi:hypothetical protein